MSVRLHVQSDSSPRRQASPTPAAHDYLSEAERPPHGWRVFYAVDPVTQANIGEARCRVTDDATAAIDWLQGLVERSMDAHRTGPQRVD